MDAWINLVAVVAFAGGLFCVFIYASGAPWWRTDEGRNYMTFTAIATALFGLRVLTLVFGDGYPGQTLLRAVLFTAAAVALWWRARIIYRVQIRDHLEWLRQKDQRREGGA